MNSRNKGKVGEREFAALLREHGFDARRGQQFSGSPDSPDVVSEALAWLHVEVKRVQNLNLANACAQAARDSAGKPWIVAHRRNHAPWFITMDAEFFFELIREFNPAVLTQRRQDAEMETARGDARPTEKSTSEEVIELRGAEAADFLAKVFPKAFTKRTSNPVLADGQSSQTGTSAREDARPTNTISSPVLADGHKAGSDQQTEQTKQNQELRP